MKKITVLVTLVFCVLFIKAQTLEEIIQKNIENSGGQKLWENLTSQRVFGKLHNTDGVSKIETYSAKGFSYGLKEVDGKFRVEFGFDGIDYWRIDYKTKKLTKSSNEASARAKKNNEHIGSYFVNYKEKGYEITLLEDDFIQDEECFVLEINRGKKPKFGEMADDIIIVYLSKKTYLKVAEELEYIRGSFETILYVYYDDYRDVEGLKLPFKYTHILNEYTYKILIDKYELNTEVDKSSIKFGE